MSCFCLEHDSLISSCTNFLSRSDVHGVIVVAFVDVVVQVFAVVTCKHVPEYIEVVQV